MSICVCGVCDMYGVVHDVWCVCGMVHVCVCVVWCVCVYVWVWCVCGIVHVCVWCVCDVVCV